MPLLPNENAAALLAMQELSAINPEQLVLFSAYRDLARIVYGSLFLRMVSDLREVAFASLAMTPTLSQCFSRMITGELSLASSEGRAQIGAHALAQ